MNVDVLYLSPHPDDVAFSASGRIARDVALGRSVALMTVFEVVEGQAAVAELDEDPRRKAFVDRQARRQEDEAFAKLFGISLRRADLPDFISREPNADLSRPPPALAEATMNITHPIVAKIVAAIEALINEGVRELLSPLGIGWHIDHQLTYGAARVIERMHPQLEVSFYEDTPYTFRSGRRASRLRELEVCDEEILEGETLIDSKLAGVACYPSQWEASYSSLDAWRQAFMAYAAAENRRLAFERVWRTRRAQGAPQERSS
jgi:LmbE family N-acetylglucosaminyl deacetylase